MPELPEVEAERRFAERHLAGRILAGASAAPDPIVFDTASPRRVAGALRGRTVVAARRKGKHLWLELDRRPWLTLHFGMGGRLHAYEKASERPLYWKLEVRTGDGSRVAMTNPRRLGRVRLVHDPGTEGPISRLGPDPLLELPSIAVLRERLGARRAPVKAVLLDQAFLAGVGNWIADEVLYQAKLDPRRPAADLAPEEVRRLRERLRSVIRKAVEVNADASRFPRAWLFHVRWGRKAGAKTARGEPIAFTEVGGRTTAWVPSAQG